MGLVEGVDLAAGFPLFFAGDFRGAGFGAGLRAAALFREGAERARAGFFPAGRRAAAFFFGAAFLVGFFATFLAAAFRAGFFAATFRAGFFAAAFRAEGRDRRDFAGVSVVFFFVEGRDFAARFDAPRFVLFFFAAGRRAFFFVAISSPLRRPRFSPPGISRSL